MLECNELKQFLTSACFLVFLAFTPQNAEIAYVHQDKESIKNIVEILQSCPAWVSTSAEEREDRRHILEQMKKISHYDIQDIRDALIIYVNSVYSKTSDIHADLGKIYVLNRYVFDVPTSPLVEGKIRRFAGWIGEPFEECEKNWSWPLSIDNDGKLVLTGTLHYRMGPLYQAIEEFDYLRQRFGLRKF